MQVSLSSHGNWVITNFNKLKTMLQAIIIEAFVLNNIFWIIKTIIQSEKYLFYIYSRFFLKSSIQIISPTWTTPIQKSKAK